MNRNKILAIVLAVQAVAALIYLFSGSKLDSHAGISKLLVFDSSEIDRVIIEDGEGSVAEVYRSGDNWVTSEDFPITQDRIQNLLQDISELDHGLAVATTSEAARRFKVADDAFERHVRLYGGDKLIAEFYLGTGAGARRNHIRLAGESSIFVAELATYAVPAEIGDWQDKEQLQIEEDAITSIQVDGMTIERLPEPSETVAEDGETEGEKAPRWTTDALSGEETLNVEALEEQLGNLAGIRYDLAFKGSLEEASDGNGPVKEIIVSYGDGDRIYQFYKAAEGDDYILKVSDRDELFEISQYSGNRIIENIGRESLIQQPEPEEDPATDNAGGEDTTTTESENTMPWAPGS